VIPAACISDWVYQAGPSAWGKTPTDGDNLIEEAKSDAFREDNLRFLPQGDLADEIWRRNFDSLWRGPRFRALAKS
jgi:hypothetical protein